MGGRMGVATRRGVPDFFIVGHQKCGTTALYKMLKGHPQIFLPDVKEPRYFLSDAPTPARKAPAATRARKQTLEEYLALFAPAGPEQLIGEASPQYLRSTTAASAIAELQPDARIVAILREPVAFLRSFHLQMLSNNAEDQRDFGKAMALEGLRRQGRRIPRHCEHPAVLMYSEHVRYVEQVRRFETQFSRENVLVLVYEDYRRDNEQAVRTVQRFLGVEERAPEHQVETHPNPGVRFPALHRLAWGARRARRNPRNAEPLARAVSTLTPDFARSEGFRAQWRRVVYKEQRPLDERLVAELRHSFKPEVVAISEYLGRDLVSLWGYDALD